MEKVPTEEGEDTVEISLELQTSAELISRFESLARSFEGFEDALINRKAIQSDTNERRIQKLLRDINVIESNVVKETQNRQESIKALKDMFSLQLDEMKMRLEQPIAEKFSELSSRLDSVASNIKLVDDKVEEDRIAFPKQIEKRSQALISELKRFKERCQAENVTRQLREKELLAVIDEHSHTATERFKMQRFSMEQRQMALDQEIVAERRIQQRDAESLLEQTKVTLKELKANLEQCNKERVQSIKEVTQVMTHYAAALQDGVNIVSQAAGL